MIVTKETTYEEFAAYEPHVSDEDKKRLEQKAVEVKYGQNGFYGMTLGAFLDGIHGRFEPMWDNGGLSVFDIYRTKAFAEWTLGFTDTLAGLSLKPTAKQQQYQQGCRPVSFEESIYLFCRSYFGLHSFDAVLDLTVADYLLAKKDDYNKQVCERNMMKSTLKP